MRQNRWTVNACITRHHAGALTYPDLEDVTKVTCFLCITCENRYCVVRPEEPSACYTELESQDLLRSAVKDSAMDDMDDNEPLRRWYKYHRPEYLRYGRTQSQTETSSRGKRGKLIKCVRL